MKVKSIVMLTLVTILALPATGAWAKGKGPKKPKGPKHVTVNADGSADYADIQTAVDDVPDGTRIRVEPGTYSGFVVEGRRNLKIEAKGKHHEAEVVVSGSVSPPTYRGTNSLTIGVIDSTKIEISGLKVEAGLADWFTIAYFNSTGKIKNSEVSGNTDSANPGNGIAAFGISSPGTVTIENNYVHGYGKIGILVNSWDPVAGNYVPGGMHARVKKNVIVGTDFADYWRVQDGIQVTFGGSADIEDNDISRNFQSETDQYGYTYRTCDGILLYDAHHVKTKHNDIYDNQRGITIRHAVGEAKLEHDKIEDNLHGIDSYTEETSAITVKHAKVKYCWYGARIWDTDGILFDHCHIEENGYGIWAIGSGYDLTAAGFTHCHIIKNLEADVWQAYNTLVFQKVKYDTYVNWLDTGVLVED